MKHDDRNVRFLSLLCLAALGLPGRAPAADPGPRLVVARSAEALPERVRQALETLAAAAERGDRSAFLEALLPASRASAAPRVVGLVAASGSPRADVRLELFAAAPEGADWRGQLVYTARINSRGQARGAQVLSFRTWARHDAALKPWIELAELPPADVRAVDAELGIDVTATRFHVKASLEVESRWDDLSVVLLTCPRGSTPSLSTPGATLTLLGETLEKREGLDVLRVDLATPLQRGQRTSLLVERDCDFAEGLVANGAVYLPHPAVYLPWAGTAAFRHAVTVDVLESLRSVSMGSLTELSAPQGRRRSRFTCEREVRIAAVAVAAYRVLHEKPDGTGLELWRTREVGGDGAALLAQFRDLVAFYEKRIGRLPYDDYRFVELPTTLGLATSYPSLIFMAPDMMALKEQRWEILSHEIAHQWWGNAVTGDDNTRWISEGMAEALRDLAVLDLRGRDEYRVLRDRHFRAYLGALDAGVRPLATSAGNGPVVYDRGALAVHALHDLVGDEVFWSILRAWYSQLASRRVSTDDLEQLASHVAKRDLSVIFGPWLRSSALPVLSLEEWKSQSGREGSVVLAGSIVQEDPAFTLAVPLRAVLDNGERFETVVPCSGPRTEFKLDLASPTRSLEMDPEVLTPRILPEDLKLYWQREARACIARGERTRGIELYRKAAARGLLTADDALLLHAALLCEGRKTEADQSLATVFGELPSAELRQRALFALARKLLDAGAPEPALALLVELDAQMDAGASVPLHLALALRALGREQEARAAFGKALERRPDCEEARVALGLIAAPSPTPHDAELQALLPTVALQTKGNSAAGMKALALGAGRVVVLQGEARRLLAGTSKGMHVVAGYSPTGAADAVVVGAAGSKPRFVVLEAGRRKAALAVFDISAEGSAHLVARHERCPGGLMALLSTGTSMLVGSPSRDGGVEWHRFRGELHVASEGPDDEDGLLTLKVPADQRFEKVGESPDGLAAWMEGMGLVHVSGASVEGASGPVWEFLGPEGKGSIRGLSAAGEELVLLTRSDRNMGPLEEDAQWETRLVVASQEDMRERALPSDVVAVSLAPDGDFVVVEEPESGTPLVRFGHLAAK